MAASSLLLFIGFYRFSFASFFPERFRWEMVSRKNQGFQISESRQNHVQVNVSNRMTMGAVNVRF
jgi:hypothetical protein